MLQKALRLYGLFFRLFGQATAILSAVVSLMIGVGVLRDGLILVNGHQSTDVASICTAVCTSLAVVAFGQALFYFVPKAARPQSDPVGK